MNAINVENWKSFLGFDAGSVQKEPSNEDSTQELFISWIRKLELGQSINKKEFDKTLTKSQKDVLKSALTKCNSRVSRFLDSKNIS